MNSVVVLFDDNLFDSSVHSFHLADSPRMLPLRYLILDIIFDANSVKCVAF